MLTAGAGGGRGECREGVPGEGGGLSPGDGAGAVFVTGGETARGLAAGLGLRELFVEGTIEPGLVLAAAATPAGEALLLAVKPGGFGDADTWIRAADALGLARGP